MKKTIWLKDGKTQKEFLKRGDKFYRFRRGILCVEVYEVEFIGFLEGFGGQETPIFYVDGIHMQIPYFWRDFVLCSSYPAEGWYMDKESCLEAGKQYYTECIQRSKL